MRVVVLGPAEAPLDPDANLVHVLSAPIADGLVTARRSVAGVRCCVGGQSAKLRWGVG